MRAADHEQDNGCETVPSVSSVCQLDGMEQHLDDVAGINQDLSISSDCYIVNMFYRPVEVILPTYEGDLAQASSDLVSTTLPEEVHFQIT